MTKHETPKPLTNSELESNIPPLRVLASPTGFVDALLNALDDAGLQAVSCGNYVLSNRIAYAIAVIRDGGLR